MTCSSKIPFNPSIAADASHHLYDTGHEQHGMVVSNGSAPVGYRSGKITDEAYNWKTKLCIALKYMPTRDMVADLLTKPVTKAVLNRLKQKLFNDPVNIKLQQREQI
jgi:hypothetical protein